MISELTQQLNRDEGRKGTVYKDSLGLWTIGVGRLVDPSKPGSGLRDDEMDYLLRNDINDRIDALTRALPWFQDLDDARKGVLLNMAFQLGTQGLLGFVNTLAKIKEGDYSTAATMMLQSRWAQQTPERANRLAKQMASGTWQ
jgi:lysozyme